MTTVPFRKKTSAAGLVAALRGDSHAPVSAMIEIADRCNEVCVHCYQIQGQKGEMTTEELIAVLDQLAEMGVLFLTLSGGEPTLRKDFLEIVAHARRRKFAVKIFSNGLRIDEPMADRLAELAVQEVQMSLYSHRASAHDGVTGVPGSFERTVDAARHLLARGVSVVLKSPLMSVNVGEVDAYMDFVTGLGADYALDPEMSPREDGDLATEAMGIGGADYVAVKRHGRLAAARALGPDTGTPEAALDTSVCGACSGNVHIEANGEMRPCTQLAVPVGNARREPISKAWNENTAARAIRELTWESLHGCRECDLRPYCNRCFATAYHQGGDMLGPYAHACERAQLEYEVAHEARPRIVDPDGRGGPEVGPYRRLRAGVFALAEDRVTADDEEFARRHRWARDRERLVPVSSLTSRRLQENQGTESSEPPPDGSETPCYTA